MANRHRGDVPIELGGQRLALRLTLGGLAELEDALGAGDLAALGVRLGSGRLSARDILFILRTGLKGAGHSVTDQDIAALPLAGQFEPMLTAVVTLLAGTLGLPEQAPESPTSESPNPESSPPAHPFVP